MTLGFVKTFAVALVATTTMIFSGSVLAAGNGISFDVAGKHWVSTRADVFKSAMGDKPMLNITGLLEAEKKSKLSFNILPPADADYIHSYELHPLAPDTKATGSFNTDMLGGNVMESSFQFQSGTVQITAYDAAKHLISGTFSGKLKNHSGSAQIEITNGVFTDVDLTP